ncbi:uncharacterized protein BX664DRAFT_258357 [Halteromyces radiatus]|uniref:uncharacterized protein n=1 Tax=Halteromyces radiatus TaxID=101107 RepID=UPI00221E5DA8|nr:uncharacterized protein BX664DRAFT_258357 [Halteromyces radiatus]KAI8096501.1 hypothetical protein BX664DRAFT_258357 [Halteromyces radiatus]
MAGLETVIGTHNFDAENADEISFSIGEVIVVLEKDEGYQDGWWQGRNARGEIGLFPMNYTTPNIPSTLDSLENKIDSLETAKLSSKYVHQSVATSLQNPELQTCLPEDWSAEQVSIWLGLMGFSDIASTFQDQEITGDILLELNVDSLKELNVSTFGKRFKIYNAIKVLADENMTPPPPPLPPPTSHIPYVDDDLVSDYSSIIRNSSSANNEQLKSPQSTSSISSSPPLLPADPRRIFSLDSARPLMVNSSSVNNSLSRSATPINRTLSTTASSSSSPTNTHLINTSRASMDGIAQRLGNNRENVLPDMEGWLHKQGDKYKTWNKRWFVLKGSNLFYFKSPKDIRMKGIINLRGYRIITDETIYAGKFCFRAQHERERTFYFYTDTESSMKEWVKTLIKATITRDFTAPVMSSSTIPTVSLDAARRMKPRPPSMIYGKDTDSERPISPSLYDSRPFSLTYKDQAEPIMRMSMSDETHNLFPLNNQTQESGLVRKEPNNHPSAANLFYHEEDEDLIDPHQRTPHNNISSDKSIDLSSPTEHYLEQASWHWDPADYVDWMNRHMDQRKIAHVTELRTGESLVELLEAISGKEVRRPSTTARVGTSPLTSMQMLDNIVAAFKFMGREGVVVDGRYNIKDIFSGNEVKILEMLRTIKDWADQLHPSTDKMASGGTFGEEEQGKLKALDEV